MKTVIVIALTCILFGTSAHAKECTKMEAYAAESVTAYLDSWGNVNLAFREFGHCDDGSVAEGFDEAISKLWAKQWHHLPSMLKYTKESKSFKKFVYKRIWSETIPAERWQNILKKAQTECPYGGKEFCSEVVRASNGASNQKDTPDRKSVR